MLLGQHGRRHQHGDLLAVVDRLERGADGQLGLAVADVAADQPVHRPRPLHVALDLAEGGELVGRLLVGEGGLELGCQSVSGGIGDAGLGLAQRLQLDHLAGQVEDRLLDACPSCCCQLVPPSFDSSGSALRAADVLLHQVDLRRRHVDARAVAELQDQVLLGLAVLLQHLHAAVAGDAVADVDDQVALVQVEEAVDGPRLEPAPRQHRTGLLAMEQFVIAEDDDAGRRWVW